MPDRSHASLVEMIDAVLRGTANQTQVESLDARLRTCKEDRRTYLRHMNLDSALRQRFASEPETKMDSVARSIPAATVGSSVTWPVTVVALAAMALIAVFLLRSPDAGSIAKVSQLTGGIRWTGNDGKVLDRLRPGQALTGGTLETTTVESGVELHFGDGSTVTLGGSSQLTMAENTQRHLHLRQGSLTVHASRNVEPSHVVVQTPHATAWSSRCHADLYVSDQQTKLVVHR
ncbi:MAG: FecR domain-containing protein, partial [Planctomycetota bacterium]